MAEEILFKEMLKTNEIVEIYQISKYRINFQYSFSVLTSISSYFLMDYLVYFFYLKQIHIFAIYVFTGLKFILPFLILYQQYKS